MNEAISRNARPEGPPIDPVAEATGGQHNWNDPGMADSETGHEEFSVVGLRVEVRTEVGWQLGTVVETTAENDCALVVECDDVWHDRLDNYGGRGATLPVIHNTRRGILSNIRQLPKQETA